MSIHVILILADQMQNAPMEFVHACPSIKETHMLAVDPNVSQTKSVQKIKLAWKTNARILALEFAVQMLCVKLPIIYQSVYVLLECLEIHLSLVNLIKVIV